MNKTKHKNCLLSYELPVVIDVYKWTKENIFKEK